MKKNIRNLCFVTAAAALGWMACSKMKNEYYANGSTPALAASSTTLTPTATDSLTNILGLTWTNPHYATDSSTELYTIQIDSTGRNFAKAVSFQVAGALLDSFTGKQLNTIALGFGFSYRTAYGMDIRVTSSYGNNNEGLVSNTVTVTYTPYVTPPVVTPPAGQLFLVGAASQGGWNAPVPVPSQVFEKVDSVDYAGVFKLIGGQQFLILPQNTGSYDNKLATNDNSETGAGGTFGINDPNNFTGPTASGWYTIWLNFQTGSFTIAAAADSVPDSLFLVGSATADMWNNPVPEPSQVFTQLSSSQFSISAPLSAGGALLFLPVNGSWTNKYATNDAGETGTGGTFGYNFNNNFTGPTNAGTYTISVDFVSGKFTISSE